MNDPSTRPVAPPVPGVASSAIAPVLRGPDRPVRVLGAFRAAVYLGHDDGVLALVTTDGIVHPNAVVVDRPAAFAGLRPHQRGTVGGGHVTLPGLDVQVSRWRDPRPRLGAVEPAVLRDRVASARHHLAVTAPRTHDGHEVVPDATLEAHAAAVAGALAARDVTAAVDAARRLLGRGPGLTPAGDDVLAGLFAATVTLAPVVRGGTRHGLVAAVGAAGAEVADLARDATTAVSAALLHHAVRGEVAAPAAEVLHALTGRGDLPAALTRLLAVGSTSGRDLTVGLLAGADLVVDPLASDPLASDPLASDPHASDPRPTLRPTPATHTAPASHHLPTELRIP